MWFGARGEEVPLGTAELPAMTPARVTVPCGERFDWDIASEHYLACAECDRIHRERNFIDPQMG